jgi:hypothetical protein
LKTQALKMELRNPPAHTLLWVAPLFVTATLSLNVSGCGSSEPAATSAPAASSESVVVTNLDNTSAATESDMSASIALPSAQPQSADDFAPLSLSNLPSSDANKSGAAANDGGAGSEQQIQTIIAQLQPLQILLGQWRGTTRREYENFKAVDAHQWIWDLQTEPERPALTIQSDKSPYLRTGRISWDDAAKKFTLAAVDGAGMTRRFIGEFTEPVHEVLGSDDKLHRVFRLEFNESAAGGEGNTDETWQLAFVQQENNRYLLEVARRRGNAAFARFDTVSTQREGTSFAASDSDYAEKTCIISEGLGTMELTYKGRSYWVCCTGCKAAFEDDPEKWIARSAKRDAKK